jgi:transcriptional antiterminator NusG
MSGSEARNSRPWQARSDWQGTARYFMTETQKSAILTLMNYYIIQVATGREQGFIDNLNTREPELARMHNFIYLTRELNIRRRGVWHKELQPVFPSYIIMQTTGVVDSKTVQTLKGLPDFYHFLKSNTQVVPLAGTDLQIIEHFLGLGPRIGPSLVRFDQDDRIVVIEGPLKGIEGSIIKVDRRKQRAKIRVDFAGSAHTMDLSFEDIERK